MQEKIKETGLLTAAGCFVLFFGVFHILWMSVWQKDFFHAILNQAEPQNSKLWMDAMRMSITQVILIFGTAILTRNDRMVWWGFQVGSLV